MTVSTPVIISWRVCSDSKSHQSYIFSGFLVRARILLIKWNLLPEKDRAFLSLEHHASGDILSIYTTDYFIL